MQQSTGCTDAAFAEVRALVVNRHHDGLLRGCEVAKLAHHVLGESYNCDGGGVSVAVLRQRVRPYLEHPSLALPVSFLPAALQTLCSVTLSQSQVREINELVVSGGTAAGPGALLALHTGASSSQASSHSDLVPYSPAEKYSSMSIEDLRAELQHRDWELAVSKKKGAATSRKMCYWRSRCQDLQEVVDDRNQEIESIRNQLNLRSGVKKVSLLGGYLLAWKRNLSHTSAAAIVSILGGDDDRGGLRSKDVVIKFEHLACGCQRLASELFYSGMLQQIADSPPAPGDDNSTATEVHAYMGDATNEDAAQKSKVHVGLVWSTYTASAADGEPAVAHAVADVQVVRHGSGAETHAIFKRQMQSVSCPTWDAPVPASTFRVYVMMLDSGPDNLTSTVLAREETDMSSRVALLVQFCFLHQFSLMMNAFYSVLDGWYFEGEAITKPGYAAGVAAVANSWRAPGVARRLWAICASLFDEAVAERVFGKTPGRAVRTRWGSLNSVEKIIVSGHVYLSSTFQCAFASAAKSQRSHTLLSELDDPFREEYRRYRTIASVKLGDPLFIVRCMVSDVAQGPLSHFQLWVQRKNGMQNKAVEQLGGKAYLGTTVMSDLVSWKADSIRGEFDALLSDGPGDDQDHWGPLWSYVPYNHVQDARALIMTLVLCAVCQWDMRIMARVAAFPCLLLLLVDKPAAEVCSRRKAMAAELLSMRECCLQDRRQDFTLKVLRGFKAQLETVARLGTCPAPLHHMMLLVRSLWLADTQRVEGANSVLQTISKRAPNIHIPLLSDRLSLKLGEKILARDCCALHTDVVLRLSSSSTADRFSLPIAGDRPRAQLPLPPPRMICTHAIQNDAAGRLAKGIQCHIADTVPVDARQAIQIELVFGTIASVTERVKVPAFILGAKLYKTCRCVQASLFEDQEPAHLSVQMPLRTSTLKDILEATLRDHLTSTVKLKYMVVTTYTVAYNSLAKGIVTSTTAVRSSPKLAQMQQPSKKPRVAEAAEPEPRMEFDVPDQDDPGGDQGDVDLEAELSDILEGVDLEGAGSF